MRVDKALSGIAKVVRVARQETNLSISEFAQKTRTVSESTIRRLEKAGKSNYNPSMTTLIKMANNLRIPLSILVDQQIAKTVKVAKRKS